MQAGYFGSESGSPRYVLGKEDMGQPRAVARSAARSSNTDTDRDESALVVIDLQTNSTDNIFKIDLNFKICSISAFTRMSVIRILNDRARKVVHKRVSQPLWGCIPRDLLRGDL